MNRISIAITILLLLSRNLSAQDTARVDQSSLEENITLYTMMGIVVPLAVAGTVISSFPPSVSIVSKNGVNYGAVNIESGFGIGETRETGIFSDWRVGLSYTMVVNSKVRNVFRTELKREMNFSFIDRRKIVVPGIHVSAGVLSDFPNMGYTVGAGAWLKTPWIGYFGFFPQHTFGFTYRYNKYFRGNEFHEFSIGMTSAFTF